MKINIYSNSLIFCSMKITESLAGICRHYGGRGCPHLAAGRRSLADVGPPGMVCWVVSSHTVRVECTVGQEKSASKYGDVWRHLAAPR